MFTFKLLWLHTQTKVSIGVVRMCYWFKLDVYACDHSKPSYVYFYQLICNHTTAIRIQGLVQGSCKAM